VRFNCRSWSTSEAISRRRDAPRGRTTKVFAIGGTGRIGRASSKILAENEIVSQVAIAGRDLRLAKQAAVEIGPKAIAIEVDATDEVRLASLARGYDLVVNTAGPDFRVALPVTRAAISAGVHCCDIAADGPSLERVLALDGKAQKAGVTIVTGIGHIPGTSNLMMQHAANQLDTVTDLQLCVWWQLTREETDLFGDADAMRKTGRINASWQTVLTWVAGRVRTYRGGRLVEVDPFEEATEVALPMNGGTVRAIPIGSTEPITFPRRIPALRSVSVLMALLPPQLNELLRVQSQRIASGKSDVATATMAFLDAIAAEPDRWLQSRTKVPTDFGMMATATGTRGNQTLRYSCWPAGPWESTVGPLTTAALRILHGNVRTRGVSAPEAIFEPIPFLEEAAQVGLKSNDPGRLLRDTEEVLG
jgi:saccharopine dehydrogenase (NAD+, L-lysine-forming)